MLIPHQYKQYEWIAFLDLDVLISNNAPSIFDFVDDTKAFAASTIEEDRGLRIVPSDLAWNHWPLFGGLL